MAQWITGEMPGETVLYAPQLKSDNPYINCNDDSNDIPIFDLRNIKKPENTEQYSHLSIATVFRSLDGSPYGNLGALLDINEITIEQTYELHDLLTVVQSENRYFIKSNGDIVFGGIEESLPIQRFLCGSKRRLKFRLFDRSRQEAIYFFRRMAFVNPIFGCWLQKVKIFLPNSNYIGAIKQMWTPFKTTLHVLDSENDIVYKVVGPTQFICPIFRESPFNVFNRDGEEISKIRQEWNGELMNYRLTVTFPDQSNTTQKALLMICGILIEYMFFESDVGGSWVTCHR